MSRLSTQLWHDWPSSNHPAASTTIPLTIKYPKIQTINPSQISSYRFPFTGDFPTVYSGIRVQNGHISSIFMVFLVTFPIVSPSRTSSRQRSSPGALTAVRIAARSSLWTCQSRRNRSASAETHGFKHQTLTNFMGKNWKRIILMVFNGLITINMVNNCDLAMNNRCLFHRMYQALDGI